MLRSPDTFVMTLVLYCINKSKILNKYCFKKLLLFTSSYFSFIISSVLSEGLNADAILI